MNVQAMKNLWTVSAALAAADLVHTSTRFDKLSIPIASMRQRLDRARHSRVIPLRGFSC
jgi:hypothetical protein